MAIVNQRKEILWQLAAEFAESGKDEYPAYWDRLARQIKNDAAWKCEICGHPHDPKNGYTLTVHHLIETKSLCLRWNLAALCQRCHLRIQGRLDLYREVSQFQFLPLPGWLVPHLEGFKEWRKGKK